MIRTYSNMLLADCFAIRLQIDAIKIGLKIIRNTSEMLESLWIL